MGSSGSMHLYPLTLHNMIFAWHLGLFAAGTLAVTLAVAFWYVRAVIAVRSQGRSWSALRTAAFLGGLATVVAAIASPVATFTANYFQAHVLQHLLLMVVAPPLLAMGAPSTLLLQTSSRRLKSAWLKILSSKGFAVLTHPVTVSILFYGIMYYFFLTGAIGYAMEHMWVMDLFNLLFLFGATLFWWPMVAIDPIVHWKMGYGGRMITVLLGVGFESFLGVALLSETSPVAPMYSLASTRAGGGLLWSAAEVVTLVAVTPIYLQWMRSEERLSRRRDAELDRQSTVGTPQGPQRHFSNDPKSDAWATLWKDRSGYIPSTDQAGTSE